MFHRLDAEFITSAPLLMSGHGPLEKGDQLRPSALKGALRFWWRALQWPRIRRTSPNDQTALQRLHELESALFGNAAGNTGHQSAVLLRLSGEQQLDEEVFKAGKKLSLTGAVYLMGQGQHNSNTGSKTAGLQAKKPLTLSLIWRGSSLTEEQQQGLIEAVKALGLLGSVGARARKGFGSLSLQRLTLDGHSLSVPQNRAELAQWFSQLERQCGSTELPPFTAFSNSARCWTLGLKPASSGLGLLNEYGLELMRYRGSDKPAIGGVQGRGLFKGDSRELRKLIEGDCPTRAPFRAAFGLPHNLHFIDCGEKIEVKPAGLVRVNNKNLERRASPLLAHLHQFPNRERVMLVTLLPAQFLPEGEKLTLKHVHGKSTTLPFQPDWQIFDGFISQCQGKELAV